MARPKLIESAVDQVIDLLRKRLPMMLEVVQGEHQNGDEEKITLEPVSPDRYYISEQLEPLKLPAVFILDDVTRFEVGRGQNITHAVHMVNVTLLVEDITTRRLVRKTWRYARAAYLALHDQQTMSLNAIVERVTYGPTFRREARSFSRDITLAVRLMHFEDF